MSKFRICVPPESLRVAEEKIRHLEAESKGLLDAAEFREKEASSFKEGANLAEERAHAHEKALASALEQVVPSMTVTLFSRAVGRKIRGGRRALLGVQFEFYLPDALS